MALSNDLISQFAKIVGSNETKKETKTTAYGKTVVYNGKTYVKLDGSELLTPVNSTVSVEDNDRVTVSIEDHTATITGNLSDPSASSKKVSENSNKISEFEIVIADKVNTKELEAEKGRIDDLVSDNVTIKETLTATNASIKKLVAEDVEINKTLTAQDATIKELDTEKLDAKHAEITYATIEELKATNADVYNLNATYGEFEELTTKNFEAVSADIEKLNTDKLNSKEAEITYANIDFSNIEMAAVKELFTKSGIIKDLVVGDQSITGELVGVTIKGDLIEAGTVKADRLVVKGSDGLYYALNVAAGVTTSAEVSEAELQNGLHGDVLVKKSVVAEKIAVDDLVAFDATIGGFKITSNSLYSGVKESVDNTTRGTYLDDEGQIALGDSNYYLKYYHDDEDDTYKLSVVADSVLFGSSGKNIESELSSIEQSIENTESSSNSSASKIEQLRSLMSQLITDEEGNTLMTETPESYVLTTETLTGVSGTILQGVSTTTGEAVYLATDSTNAGTYYSVVDSVYYKVSYTPATCTFSIADLESTINNTNSELSSLSGHLSSIDSTVVSIQQAVDDLGLIGGYIYIDNEFETGGTTVPAIILGESDSDFKVVITNKQIAFMEGASVPAYISGQTLIAQTIDVEKELKQGGFSWIVHDGNLGLVWGVATTVSVTYDVDNFGYESNSSVELVNCPKSAVVGESFTATMIVHRYANDIGSNGDAYCDVYNSDTGGMYSDYSTSWDRGDIDEDTGDLPITLTVNIPTVYGGIRILVSY